MSNAGASPYWSGHGPIRCHLVRQESLLHTHYSPRPQPCLGRDALLPCPALRDIVPHPAYGAVVRVPVGDGEERTLRDETCSSDLIQVSQFVSCVFLLLFKSYFSQGEIPTLRCAPLRQLSVPPRTYVHARLSRLHPHPHYHLIILHALRKEASRRRIDIDEAACLEEELGRPDIEKKRLDVDDNMPDTSVTATSTSVFSVAYTTEPMQMPLAVAGAGSSAGSETSDVGSDADGEGDLSSTSNSNAVTPLLQPADAPLGTGAVMPEKKPKKMRLKRLKRASKSSLSGDNGSSAPPTPGGSDSSANPVERVINVKKYPLCHHPRLNSKAEIDIITHLAICVRQDWNKVDRIGLWWGILLWRVRRSGSGTRRLSQRYRVGIILER